MTFVDSAETDMDLDLDLDLDLVLVRDPLTWKTNLQILSAVQTLKSDQIHFDWSIINHQLGRSKLTPRSGDQTHNYDHVVSP